MWIFINMKDKEFGVCVFMTYCVIWSFVTIKKCREEMILSKNKRVYILFVFD